MYNTDNHIIDDGVINSEMNTSIDEKEFDTNDFKIDLKDLLNDDCDFPNIIEESQFLNTKSDPIKNTYTPNSFGDINGGNSLKKIDLQPVSNDLFQVTNNVYKSPQKKQRRNIGFQALLTNEDEDSYSSDLSDESILDGQKLRNDKMHKLVDDLSRRYASENPDYEMDDQLRTRFYKGRFNKNQNPLMNSDTLDSQLEQYLTHSSSIHNDNKENVTINNKGKNIREISLKRRNKGILKSAKQNPKIRSKNIPVLKPLTNFPNVELERLGEFSVKRDEPTTNQERGKCIPKHRQKLSLKSSLKNSPQDVRIYLVDSLTGLINDATQFGTELNASNCEGFPLPEDVNEVVQIPTNEDLRPEKKKLAIIKLALRNSKNSNMKKNKAHASTGFYSKKALRQYHDETSGSITDSSEVQVVSQPTIHSIPASETKLTKKVQWADELEW